MRLLPQDSYWIAKRMTRVSDELLRWAIAGGRISNSAVRDHLFSALRARRRLLLSEIYAAVSPLEVVRTDGRQLVLRDEAVVQELRPAGKSSYVVRYLDQQGEAAAPAVSVRAIGAETAIALPRPTTSVPRYLVVSVRVSRNDKPAPRPLEAHLVQTASGGHVVGVRH